MACVKKGQRIKHDGMSIRIQVSQCLGQSMSMPWWRAGWYRQVSGGEGSSWVWSETLEVQKWMQMESYFVSSCGLLCQPTQNNKHSFSSWKQCGDPTCWVADEHVAGVAGPGGGKHPTQQPNGIVGKSPPWASGDWSSSASSTGHRSTVWPWANPV